MSNRICKISGAVQVESIRFRNRYGIDLAGELYYAKSIDRQKKHAAIVIGAPYGGVKEQGPSVYANELAQRGFVVMTFDPSFSGESGGSPRNVASPDLYSEDVSAVVDYLGVEVSFVDRGRIGALGICGSGGFVLSAAQADTRIKAVVTAALFDVSYMSRLELNEKQLQEEKQRLSYQRWIDFQQGEPQYLPMYPLTPSESIPEELNGIWREFYSFYGLKRGHHPNARGGKTTTSAMAFLNYPLLHYIQELAPRALLFITADHAESRFLSEYYYEKAAEPKELYVVSNCNHIDLYDDVKKIPFDKIEQFFKTQLHGQ